MLRSLLLLLGVGSLASCSTRASSVAPNGTTQDASIEASQDSGSDSRADGSTDVAADPPTEPTSDAAHFAAPAPVPFTSSESTWEPEDRCDLSFADVAGCDVRPAACVKPCRHPVVKPDCVDGWCRIPRGCYIAGAPPCQLERAAYTEEPTQITLTHDFALRQTELTQAEWMAVGFPNPSGKSTKADIADCMSPDCPVGAVSWFDMLAYSNRLSKLHGLPPCFSLKDCKESPGKGMYCKAVTIEAPSIYECKGYRPPTGAEWEYAVRGGTATSFFTGSMVKQVGCYEDKPLMEAVWYCYNSNSETRPVRGRAPNPWGLHDMMGNASEWVMDALESFPQGPLVDYFAENDPFDSGIQLRMFRGGAVHSAHDSFSAARKAEGPWDGAGPTLSFRIARTLPNK